MPSILDLIDRPHRGTRRPFRRMTPAERLARNSRREGECLVWTGRLDKHGYGLMIVTQAGYKPETVSAHRAAYEIAKGRVPTGLVLDHLCRNPRCIDPNHLEAVKQWTNVMRSPITLAAINAAKTHCPQGHEYNAENTHVYVHKTRSTTERKCRACKADYDRRRRLAMRNKQVAS